MLNSSPLLAIPALLGFLLLLPPAVAKSSRAWQPPSQPCDSSTHGLPHCSDMGLLAQASDSDQEDQDKRLILSNTELTLVEGEEGASFTVRLSSRLKDSEVVDVAVNSSNGEDIEINPISLRFTKENWEKPQTVNIFLKDNEIDEYDRLEEIYLSPSGNGYDKKILDLVVKDPVKELYIQEIRINENEDTKNNTRIEKGYSLSLIEGDNLIVKLGLSSKPTSSVTVSIIPTAHRKKDDKDDVDSKKFEIEPDKLEFTEKNWTMPQEVRISLEDNDIDDDGQTISICFDPSGGGYTKPVILNLVVTNNDTRGLVLSSPELIVKEGESSNFTVRLRTQPASTDGTEATDTDDNVVRVRVSTDHPEEVFVNPSILEFSDKSKEHWSSGQTVTVNRDKYSQGDRQAIIFLDPSGGDYNNGQSKRLDVTIEDESSGIIVFTVSILIGINILAFRFAVKAKINEIDIDFQSGKDNLLSQIDEKVTQIQEEVEEIKDKI